MPTRHNMRVMDVAFRTAVAVTLAAFIGGGFSETVLAESRYFRVCPGPAPSGCGSADDFIIALDDPNQIQMAEDILNGKVSDKVHVEGRIVAQPAPYNPQWKFYLDSKSISFFTFGHPTCWGYSTSQVNSNLAQVGTAGFLPTGFWCPRGYGVSQEVTGAR